MLLEIGRDAHIRCVKSLHGCQTAKRPAIRASRHIVQNGAHDSLCVCRTALVSYTHIGRDLDDLAFGGHARIGIFRG